ncbi:hypothetical protein BD289DRAFT_426475 [Coniella lustricola]|uniref:Uncharacterized protein n=1 Tax=Coniella lustricola TaxID=2025994 RepID=A0A2T3AFZ6_9PEZI|nr:hypothetical protein BD289DRAFT_426475 [Coniella lustricola]
MPRLGRQQHENGYIACQVYCHHMGYPEPEAVLWYIAVSSMSCNYFVVFIQVDIKTI